MTLIHMRGLNAPVRSERDAQADIARRRLLEALTAARQVVMVLIAEDNTSFDIDRLVARVASAGSLCRTVIDLDVVTDAMPDPAIARAREAALEAGSCFQMLTEPHVYARQGRAPVCGPDSYAMALQVDVLCRDAIAALEGLPVSSPPPTSAPPTAVQMPRDQPAKPALADPASPRLTLDDLPAPGTTRWVARRKALVVAGVRTGLLTAQQACARYGLSAEELEGWTRLVERHGEKGLRVTRIQQYRRHEAIATAGGSNV